MVLRYAIYFPMHIEIIVYQCYHSGVYTKLRICTKEFACFTVDHTYRINDEEVLVQSLGALCDFLCPHILSPDIESLPFSKQRKSLDLKIIKLYNNQNISLKKLPITAIVLSCADN
jgi:hypothetical protein